MTMDKERATSGSKNEEIDLEKEAHLSAENKSTLKGEDENIDLEKAIELAGFGRFHGGVIIITGLCLASMVLETLGISFILPAAQCDLALTTSEKGYLSGVVFIGMVMSAHAWGFCADTFGRRRVLIIASFGCWTFSFASSFAPTAGLFIASRFATGLFLCGSSSTVYAYISEFLPASNRSKIMTWTCSVISGGYFMIPGLAWVLLPVDMNWDLGFIVYTSWRLYIVILGSFLIVEGLTFLYLPETPKFLMSIGKKQEALEVLQYVYALNTGNSGDNYPVKRLKFEITASGELGNETSRISSKSSLTPRGLGKIIWRQTAPLFKKPYGWKSLMFCTLQFGIYVSYSTHEVCVEIMKQNWNVVRLKYSGQFRMISFISFCMNVILSPHALSKAICSGGMYLWIPNLLNMMTTVENLDARSESPATMCEFVSYHANRSLYSSSESTAECSNAIREEVYMSTLIVGVFYVVTYTTFGGLVSLFGKRNVLVLALILSGSAGVGSYFARDEITVTLLLSGYVALAGTCISILSAAIVDAYPTSLRAMAVSLALTFGRLGSGVAGNVLGILLESNCDVTMMGMGCITIGCGLLCILVKK